MLPPPPLAAATRSAARRPTSPTARRGRGTPRARRPSSSASSSACASESRSSGVKSLPDRGRDDLGGRARRRRPRRACRPPAPPPGPGRTPRRSTAGPRRGRRRACAPDPPCGRRRPSRRPSGSSRSKPGSRLPARSRRASGRRDLQRARTPRAGAAAACAGRPGCRRRRSSARPARSTSTLEVRAHDPRRHDLGVAQQVAPERPRRRLAQHRAPRRVAGELDVHREPVASLDQVAARRDPHVRVDHGRAAEAAAPQRGPAADGRERVRHVEPVAHEARTSGSRPRRGSPRTRAARTARPAAATRARRESRPRRPRLLGAAVGGQDRDVVARAGEPARQVVHQPLGPAPDLGPVGRDGASAIAHLEHGRPMADRRSAPWHATPVRSTSARTGRSSAARTRLRGVRLYEVRCWRTYGVGGRERRAAGACASGAGRAAASSTRGCPARQKKPSSSACRCAGMLRDDERDRVPAARGRGPRPRHGASGPRARRARRPTNAALGAGLDRAQAEVGVLAAVEALVEAAEPLEQRARVGDVAGLVPGRRAARSSAWSPGRAAARARPGPARCAPAGLGSPSSPAASSRRSSQSGAGRQSSSVKATSGAVAARQPTLRLAAAPESGGDRQEADRQPVRRARCRPVVLGADDDDLEPLARQRLARQRLEREGQASLAARGRDDHRHVRSGAQKPR